MVTDDNGFKAYPLDSFSSRRKSLTMEALGVPPINALTISRSKPLKTTHYLQFSDPSSLKFRASCKAHQNRLGLIRMGTEGEDFELKQMKDMAAARKRWEVLVREEKVKVLTPREAGYAIQLSDKTLLDVRPSTEHKKAWVKGSTWIPIFDADSRFDAGIVSRKITNFMMGGWWSGVPTLAFDNQFLSKVEDKFPKDADLIVTCQKGLRSLAACELLYNAGYRNLFWVQGGLEAAEEEDFVREGPQPFKFAGIGGVSEFLGWTDQQRAAAAKEGWGYRFVFSARLVGLFILADALFLGAQQVGHYLQDIRSY